MRQQNQTKKHCHRKYLTLTYFVILKRVLLYIALPGYVNQDDLELAVILLSLSESQTCIPTLSYVVTSLTITL